MKVDIKQINTSSYGIKSQLLKFSFVDAGISTDLLWKDHIIRYGTKVSNFTPCRTQFFQKIFHAHIYCLADASKRKVGIENTQGTMNLSPKTLPISRYHLSINTCS